MIQLIVGHKGSGKTKAIVEMANKAVKESKGYVVVIEKDVRLTYEISSAARLVYSDEYAIAGYDAVYGFITGLLAGNYDITHIYVDPVFKMCGRDFEAFTQMVNKLDSLRAGCSYHLHPFLRAGGPSLSSAGYDDRELVSGIFPIL